MDRALGALAGVAIGDAMGMPSQTLSRAQIFETYGALADFVDSAACNPVSAGLKAGTITDDTEQSLLLAHHLIARQGRVDQHVWAQELLDWESSTHARNINDLLGPSTRRALEALLRGVDVSKTGRHGTTNGAAMRVVPVGIMTEPYPLSVFVDAVEDSCRLTHSTAEAIGAAAAIAMIVSSGIQGASFEDSLPLALAAAREGQQRGQPAVSAAIAERIEMALQLASGKQGIEAACAIADEIGTSVAATQSVPTAFAIARLASGDVWTAAMFSAVVGDDTDTIGALSCGMLGASAGLSAVPAGKWNTVRTVNNLDLEPLAAGLLAIRNGAAS
jgi:ADP-ribosylglycohydrolase